MHGVINTWEETTVQLPPWIILLWQVKWTLKLVHSLNTLKMGDLISTWLRLALQTKTFSHWKDERLAKERRLRKWCWSQEAETFSVVVVVVVISWLHLCIGERLRVFACLLMGELSLVVRKLLMSTKTVHSWMDGINSILLVGQFPGSRFLTVSLFTETERRPRA